MNHFNLFMRFSRKPIIDSLGSRDLCLSVVVAVVTTQRSGNFPYFRTVRGVLPARDNGSYADPPFEAPLSGSIVTHPSSLQPSYRYARTHLKRCDVKR